MPDPSMYSGAYAPPKRTGMTDPTDDRDSVFSPSFSSDAARSRSNPGVASSALTATPEPPPSSVTSHGTPASAGPVASSAFSAAAPSVGQPAGQPNLIRDVYAPQLQDVSNKLESAYAAPRPGMFRQVAGALLSRKNPAIGGLVSGETQRERAIQPLQQEYGLVSGQIGAQRAADLATLNAQNVQSEIAGRSELANYHNTMAGIKADPPTKTPAEQTFDSLVKGGMPMDQALEKINNTKDTPDPSPLPPQDVDVGGQNHKILFDKKGNVIKDLGLSKLPKETSANEGTWTLDEDSQGNPTLFNSKTGQTKPAPPGLAKSGSKAKADAATEKLIGPARDAQQYADDYLTNGRFTGSGDEALQEKFFELAKPTTGFRMTQPQIDMLQNSRSWMSGLQAHARHATTGTWFSNDQRKQIVSTMRDLAEAKMKGQANASGGGGGGAAATDPNDPMGILPPKKQ